MSRIIDIKENFTGKDSSELMMELMEACNETVTPVPDVGSFYFFVYNPKTNGIRYDQNPLVAVTGTPMKFVPYGSSGKSLKGFVAGDTDMLFTNMPKAVSGVKKNGISCWANTGPTKILDMEPMSDLFPDYKYNDIQTFTYLDSANMSESDIATLRAAWDKVLTADSVAGHIKNKKLFHPSVYGDLSAEEWSAVLDKAGKNWVGK